MDELGARGELRQLAGDAVVEARAEGDDEVGLVHRVVGRARTVHAEHPEPLPVRSRKRAECHDRAGDGQVTEGRELDERRRGVGADDAATDVEHRPPRIGKRLGRKPDLLLIALGRRLVSGQVHVADRLVGDVGAGQILGDVDHDRPGTARARDVERFVHRAGDIERMLDHHAVLDDRHRDTHRVGLLEAVRAQQLSPHLAGDEHDRDRVHHRIADRRHEIGRTGAAGPDRDADATGRLGVALGGVPAARLVTHEDVPDPGIVERVVGREICAAGQPEYDVDTFCLKTFHQCINCTHSARLLSWSRGSRGIRLASVLIADRDPADRTTPWPMPCGRLTGPPLDRRGRTPCQVARLRTAADGAIATSGNSSSAPQCMHTASWSFRTRRRRGIRDAVRRPRGGTAPRSGARGTGP